MISKFANSEGVFSLAQAQEVEIQKDEQRRQSFLTERERKQGAKYDVEVVVNNNSINKKVSHASVLNKCDRYDLTQLFLI